MMAVAVSFFHEQRPKLASRRWFVNVDEWIRAVTNNWFSSSISFADGDTFSMFVFIRFACKTNLRLKTKSIGTGCGAVKWDLWSAALVKPQRTNMQPTTVYNCVVFTFCVIIWLGKYVLSRSRCYLFQASYWTIHVNPDTADGLLFLYELHNMWTVIWCTAIDCTKVSAG